MAKSPRKPPSASDEVLRDNLRKAYLARAKLFVSELRKNKTAVDELIRFLQQHKADAFDWNLDSLGISRAAFSKVQKAGVDLHFVFCHPELVKLNAKVIGYYRNLAAVSKKGLGQMLGAKDSDQRRSERCQILNNIISQIVEEMRVFDLALVQAVIPAEIGAEIQGTWVNIIGRGAAKRVEQLIKEYAENKQFVGSIEYNQVRVNDRNKKQLHIKLTNGWSIVFGDEPDVALSDSSGVLQSAIEIKGSLDKAGAQTRYGEAKKSFAKALKENPRCETIYLASCFTTAVHTQIDADGQVRKVFNLIDILASENKQQEFLEELFNHVIRIR